MSWSTESVIVAENNIVCLLRGILEMISFNSSANPSSSIRSASSMTRISIVSTVTPAVLRMWSMKRPGVAMITSGLARSSASWDLRLSPPTARENLMSVKAASLAATL